MLTDFFKNLNMLIDLREEEEEEGDRERLVASHVRPDLGLNPQPRYVP